MRRALFSLALIALAAGSVAAAHFGYVQRAREWWWGKPSPRLTAGDFPAGVSAPVEEVASVPMRATRLGIVPRGAVAPLLLAEKGLFKNSYALDLKLLTFEKEDELRKALLAGGDIGGVDLAALSVSQLAMSASLLRDSAPRTVMLLGRSRGEQILAAAKGIDSPVLLRGKKVGAEPRSASQYFLFWVMSRAGLSLNDVIFVPLDSSAHASQALLHHQVDAVAGLSGELEPVLKEIGGQVVSSTVDAPHLLATVLVARGDFAARYPDAIRRVIRGVLDANAAVAKDANEAARMLGDVAPYLGDPNEAIKAAPPATLRENLAFFGLKGEAPVTYAESFQSASALATKVSGNPAGPEAADTVELGPLKYVSSSRGL